jgi:hypothetical protein
MFRCLGLRFFAALFGRTKLSDPRRANKNVAPPAAPKTVS